MQQYLEVLPGLQRLLPLHAEASAVAATSVAAAVTATAIAPAATAVAAVAATVAAADAAAAASAEDTRDLHQHLRGMCPSAARALRSQPFVA